MNSKSLNQALRNVRACHSFKGHDFNEVLVSGGLGRRRAKKHTRRANRRLNKAVCNEAV